LIRSDWVHWLSSIFGLLFQPVIDEYATLLQWRLPGKDWSAL
jgi:hypothetical protein